MHTYKYPAKGLLKNHNIQVLTFANFQNMESNQDSRKTPSKKKANLAPTNQNQYDSPEIPQPEEKNLSHEFPLSETKEDEKNKSDTGKKQEFEYEKTPERIIDKSTDIGRAEARPRKEKLHLLFLSYAELSEETGISALKMWQFVKLLLDAEVFDENFTRPKAEVLFISAVGKKLMNFESFMAAMLKLSEQKYKDLPTATSCELVVTRHLLPLYAALCKGEIKASPRKSQLLPKNETMRSEIPPLKIVYSLSLDKNSKRLLNSVGQTLCSIYKTYIGKVLISAKNDEQILKIITKDLFTFLKDFDLLRNNLVSRQAIAVFLNYLVYTPDNELSNSADKEIINDSSLKCGVLFTFDRFAMFLYMLSQAGFDPGTFQEIEYTAPEKLFYLLAKMEFSKGLYKRQPLTQFSLIPPAELQKQIIKNNPWYDKTSVPQFSKNEESKEISEITDKIHKLFINYCPISSTSKINKMPLYKYLTFLKDCNIISISEDSNRKTITPTEAEIFFTKIINPGTEKMFASPVKNKPTSKLDFKMFMTLLSQIARKIYPTSGEENSEKSLVDLFNNNISSLIHGENNSYKKLLESCDISGVLGCLKKALSPCIKHYAGADGVFDYQEFMKFCKDFGVFPDVCSKPLLRSIFYSLTYAHSETPLKPTGFTTSPKPEDRKILIESKEFINQEAIIDALGICALKSYAFESDVEPYEKVLHLAEKMSRSEGLSKVKMNLGTTRLTTDDSDFMAEMRVKYKDYFSKRRGEQDQSLLISKMFAEPGTQASPPHDLK